MDTVGERLRWARDVSKLSAIKLGALIGKSPAYVRHLETGLYGPGAEAALQLSRVLGVRLEWLLHGGERPSELTIRRSVSKAQRAGALEDEPDTLNETPVAKAAP